MKVLKQLYVLLFVGILITSCDNNSVGPGSETISITITSPSNQEKFLIEEPVPCSVRVTPSVPEKVIWEANGQTIDCVNGHLSFSESGIYSIYAKIIHEGKTSQSNGLRIDVLPDITGKIYPINSRGEITDIREVNVRVESAAKAESLSSTDGVFQIRTEIAKGGLDSFNVCIYPTGNDYYDSCVSDIKIYDNWSEDDFNFNFVLVPKQWHVQSEIYDQVIDIDLEAAFSRNGSMKDGDSFYRQDRFASIIKKDRPMMRYFDRSASDVEITASDSTTDWAAIEKMEAYLGIGKIFTPATAEEAKDSKAIRVIFNESARPNHGLAQFIHNNGNIISGTVTLSSKGQGKESTIIHEAGHAMGIGHGCGWNSIMASECYDGKQTYPSYLTLEDVGYIQLLYKVRDIQAEVGAPYGIREAYETVK